MLIIAKRAGLCLPINKQTIPSTEQLPPGGVRVCWVHVAPENCPRLGSAKADLQEDPAGLQAPRADSSERDADLGRDASCIFEIKRFRVLFPSGKLQDIYCHAWERVKPRDFFKWFSRNHRNHHFHLGVTPLCGIMPHPCGGTTEEITGWCF